MHPTVSNAVYYTGLYRSVRFSDHLLAHWVLHGGSRGKYGKCIPYKYRPLSSNTIGNKVTSPDKSMSSAQHQQRMEYQGNSSAAHRARAKSAGRTTSATQRGSTYNPSALPSASSAMPAEKARGSLANVYSSEPQMSNLTEQHASRRRLHEEQQLHLGNGDAQPENRSKARGQSEPRKANAAPVVSSPQPSPRVVPKLAFLSPAAKPALLPTTPSSVRSRLESGITQAAFYSAGIADLSLSPEDRRSPRTDKENKKHRDKKQQQQRQQQNSSECDEVAREESGEEEEKGTRSSFSPSPSPRINSAMLVQQNSGKQTSSTRRPSATESIAQKTVRPSTSSSTLGRSDSAGSLRLEQSLLHAKANGSMNSMSSGPEDAYNMHSRSPAPEPAPYTYPQSKGNTSNNIPVPATKPAGRVETVMVSSPSLDPRSSSRPLLSEFAAFNEQIRARASASREDTRTYIAHSTNHRAASPGAGTRAGGIDVSNKQDADSPLKQRRVSLVKTKSDVPAGAPSATNYGGASVTNNGKNVNSVVTGGVQYGGHSNSSLSGRSHASKSRTKQELLEEVHRTLFATPAPAGNSSTSAAVGGGIMSIGSGSDSRSPVNRRNSPLDPMLLQPAYQVVAHPSFSQPISPTNSSDRASHRLQTQQDRAFAQNPVVVKAGASSGKIIQYGNPSTHPASLYSK